MKKRKPIKATNTYWQKLYTIYFRETLTSPKVFFGNVERDSVEAVLKFLENKYPNGKVFKSPAKDRNR